MSRGHRQPPSGFYFAPGTVQHFEPPRSAVWAVLRSLALPVGLVAVCFALSVFLGLAAGYFHG